MTNHNTGVMVPESQHSAVARWAVGLAAGAAIAMGVAMGAVAIVMASNSPEALDDNLAGMLVAWVLLGGLATSVVGMSMAVIASVRHERWHWLWLPLSLAPAVVAFLVLGEAFWWE